MSIQTILAVLLIASPAANSDLGARSKGDPVSRRGSGLSKGAKKKLAPTLSAAKKGNFEPLREVLEELDLSQEELLLVMQDVLTETVETKAAPKKKIVVKAAIYSEADAKLGAYITALEKKLAKLDSKKKKTVPVIKKDVVEHDGVAVVVKLKKTGLNAAGLEREIKRVKRQRQRLRGGNKLTGKGRSLRQQIADARRAWAKILKAAEKPLYNTLGSNKLTAKRPGRSRR